MHTHYIAIVPPLHKNGNESVGFAFESDKRHSVIRVGQLLNVQYYFSW